ncbi:MAG: hypothetical protein OHK93_005260 [Ramalina farinacea]|uniref:Uncharacterized protein n=1 Tax=Ramalina farinacea TaxID=258253 RepID=A0AA43U151_9LECA|nr:hypothetical protein [Ramalina farinacea]
MHWQDSLTIIVAVLASTGLAVQAPQKTPEPDPYDVTCLEEDTSGDFDWCKECSQLIDYFKTDNQVPNYISVNVANQPYYYHGPPAKWLAQCELQIGLKQRANFGVVDRVTVAQAATSIAQRCFVLDPPTPWQVLTLGGFAAPLGGMGNLIVKVNKVEQPQLVRPNDEAPALVATT